MDCVGLRNRLVDARLTVDLVGRVIVRRAAGTHFVKMVQSTQRYRRDRVRDTLRVQIDVVVFEGAPEVLDEHVVVRPLAPTIEIATSPSIRNLVKSSEVSSSNLGRGSGRETSSADLTRDTHARRGTNHVEGVREPQGRPRSSTSAGNDWIGRVEVRACTMSNQCTVQRAVFSRFQWFESSCQEISGCIESQVGPVDWLILSPILVLPAQPSFI